MEKTSSKFKIGSVVIFSTYQGYNVGTIKSLHTTYVNVQGLVIKKCYLTSYTSIKLVDLTFKYII
jgi:hypothetical protein